MYIIINEIDYLDKYFATRKLTKIKKQNARLECLNNIIQRIQSLSCFDNIILANNNKRLKLIDNIIKVHPLWEKDNLLVGQLYNEELLLNGTKKIRFFIYSTPDIIEDLIEKKYILVFDKIAKNGMRVIKYKKLCFNHLIEIYLLDNLKYIQYHKKLSKYFTYYCDIYSKRAIAFSYHLVRSYHKSEYKKKYLKLLKELVRE